MFVIQLSVFPAAPHMPEFNWPDQNLPELAKGLPSPNLSSPSQPKDEDIDEGGYRIPLEMFCII